MITVHIHYMKQIWKYNLLKGTGKNVLLMVLILGFTLCMGLPSANAQKRKSRTNKKARTTKVAKRANAARRVTSTKKAATVNGAETAKKDTVPGITTGKDFTVTSGFTPSLKEASKINFSSTTALPTPEKVPLNYNVPAQNLTFTYNPAFIQPLAVNIDTGSVWENAQFVKLGYGNYSTPYLEGGFSFGDGYHSAVTLHARHTGSKGDLPLQEFSKTDIDASGVFALGENNELDARVYYGGNNQYAYANLSPDISYDKDSLRRRFHDIGVKVGLSNKFKNTAAIDYHPTIGIDAFGDNNSGKESTLSLDVPLQKKLGETFVAKLGAGVDVSSLKTDSSSISNSLVTIRPAIEINRPDFKMNLGIIPSFYNGEFHLMPNIELEAKLRDERFIAQAGWKGYYQKNTFRSLTTFNPWVNMPSDFDYTRTSEVYGGFKGAAGDHFTFNARVSYLQNKDLPLYLNMLNSNLFDVVQDTVNNLRFHGEIGFNAKQSFSLLAGITLNNYSMIANNEQAWGLAPIELNGSMRWNIIKSVLLKSDIDMWTGAYYQDVNGSPKKLSGAVDWNLGAEVDIIKHVSLWLQVNNLLNNKYQRWDGYRTIGANIMGGVIINFGQLKK